VLLCIRAVRGCPEYDVHIGSITHRPLVTTTLPTSVRLADAMTITGIDSTGQSAGGNVLPPRQTADAGSLETDAHDLDAELLSLETDVTTTAPISVVPAERATPEQEQTRRRAWWQLNWRDVLAIVTFVAVALYVTSPLWLNLDHEMRDDPQDQAFFEKKGIGNV